MARYTTSALKGRREQHSAPIRGARVQVLPVCIQGLEAQVRRFLGNSLDARVKFGMSAQSRSMRRGDAKPTVEAAGVKGIKVAGGEIQGRFAPRRLERLGPQRLASVGSNPNIRRGGRADKRAAKARP